MSLRRAAVRGALFAVAAVVVPAGGGAQVLPTPTPTPTLAAVRVHETAAPPLPSGNAYITSLPSGADLWIDGGHVGSTPMLLGGLNPGRHTISVFKAGWAKQEASIRVVARTTAVENLYLPRVASNRPPGDGTVIVHRPAATTTLRIDGIPFSSFDAPARLAAGEHTAELDGDGPPVRIAFDVAPEALTDLVFRRPPAGHHASVVAAAASVMPGSAISIERTKIVIRYNEHVLVGHIGDPSMKLDGRVFTVDPPPVILAGRLYLPEDVLSLVTAKH